MQSPSWQRKKPFSKSNRILVLTSLPRRLNTRRTVRGRGTDKQGGTTTNNTNMFHLGTRMPSMGPSDLERWDKVRSDLVTVGSPLS